MGTLQGCNFIHNSGGPCSSHNFHDGESAECCDSDAYQHAVLASGGPSATGGASAPAVAKPEQVRYAVIAFESFQNEPDLPFLR